MALQVVSIPIGAVKRDERKAQAVATKLFQFQSVRLKALTTVIVRCS